LIANPFPLAFFEDLMMVAIIGLTSTMTPCRKLKYKQTQTEPLRGLPAHNPSPK
jgi:hypothetical protein